MRRTRRGFTLIELLTVCAIIGVLLAILLPAVQYVREGSRRVQCLNNLKQLGLAVNSYHDVNKMLPPGGIYNGSVTAVSTWNSVSWLTFMLPAMEQSALFNSLNFSLPITHPDNRQVVQAVIPGHHCPSDESSVLRSTFTGVIDWPEDVPAATTSYLGNLGDNTTRSSFGGWTAGPPPNDGALGDRDTGRGVLWRNASFVRLAAIQDGTSQTFLAGECIPDQCQWNLWAWGNGATGSTALPLNHDTSDTPDKWETCYGFKSRHSRGANFVFADGSARFISQDISSDIYKALSTRAAGEALDKTSY